MQCKYTHYVTIALLLIMMLPSCVLAVSNLTQQQNTGHVLFAVDLIRHGDRTATHQIPTSPIKWPDGLTDGELTRRGKQQEFVLGQQLRQRYVQQDHLLTKCYESEQIYVQATVVNRTQVSAQYLLLGLYPLSNRMLESVIAIHITSRKQDDLLLVKSSLSSSAWARIHKSFKPYWQQQIKSMRRQIAYWSNITAMSLKRMEEFNALADNLYVRQIHDIALPPGITADAANMIIALNKKVKLAFFQNKAVSYPLGHKFLFTVATYFKQTVNPTVHSPLRYILFVAHDGTIMAVMNAMGVKLTQTPPYAADLNFTLLKNQQQYYVVINFNNQPVSIPKCNNSNQCTLAQFSSLISNAVI